MRIVFQNVDAIGCDLMMKDKERAYVVTLFGRTAEDDVIALEVLGFHPGFHVRLRTDDPSSEFERVCYESGCAKRRRKGRNDDEPDWQAHVVERYNVASAKVEYHRRFRGFDGWVRRPYIHYEFHTASDRRRILRDAYEKHIHNDSEDSEAKPAGKKSRRSTKPIVGAPEICESDLDPLISFFQTCNIKACDWVIVDDVSPGFLAPHTPQRGVKAYTTTVRHIRSPTPKELEKLPVFAPLRTLLFDIECDSSHGEFPLARKTFQRPAMDIVDRVSRLPDETNLRACIESRWRRVFDENDKGGRLYFKQRQPLTKVDVHGTQFQNDVHNIAKVFRKTDSSITWETHVRNWDRADLAKTVDSIMNRSELIVGGVAGDPVIQIGAIVIAAGKQEPISKAIFTLNGCNEIPGTEVKSFANEAELLMAFATYVRQYNPDVLSGYNIIPFDLPYIFDRAKELGAGVLDDITDIGRLKRDQSEESERFTTWKHLIGMKKLRNQRLASAAMGENIWRRFDMCGRVQIDQLVVIRNSHNLDSYKLDAVSGHFMFGKVKQVSSTDSGNVRIDTDDIRGLVQGDYVTLSYMHGAVRDSVELRTSAGVGTKRQWSMAGLCSSNTFTDTSHSGKTKIKKLRVEKVESEKGNCGYFELQAKCATQAAAWVKALVSCKCDRWNHAKDDVPPEEIFRLQKGSDEDRTRLARYCIKDVQLTVDLLRKILALENNVAMANICGVPLSWVTDRGVGAKLQAFVSRACHKRGYLMPRLYSQDPRKNASLPFDDPEALRKIVAKQRLHGSGELNSEAVEGAFVLKPQTGIYYDPISVVDYTSLYPSSIISKDMSHENIAYRPEHVALPDGSNRKRLESKGFAVYDVTYESRVYTGVDPRENGRPIDAKSIGKRTVRFIGRINKETGKPERGIIPSVLAELLAARKRTKKQMKAAFKAGDHFLASVLNGKQLAQKITANSVYGQTGSRVSKFRMAPIAAATTAEGRSMLLNAKAFAERHYTPQTPVDFADINRRIIGAKTIYGDTDSIFVKFTVVDSNTGKVMHGDDALEASIRAGNHLEHAAAKEPWMIDPHVLEYEKTYFPFLIVSKKKYVGMKYDAGKNTASLNSMGIVLKRRDNPPVLKRIYGDIIDGIMKSKPFHLIVKQLRDQVHRLLVRSQEEGPPKLDDLTVTKRLRADYKKPRQIAHKVLADRIAARDPGNAPSSNDRIPYVFIKNPSAKLQGERIETPSYIRKNTGRVQVDYAHYVRNVIMKPVSQVLALRLEEIDNFDKERWATFLVNIAGKRQKGALTKIERERKKLASDLKRANKKLEKAEFALRKESDVPSLPPKDSVDRKLKMRLRNNARARIRRKTTAVEKARDIVDKIEIRIQEIRDQAVNDILSGKPTTNATIPPDKMTTLKEREVGRLIFEVALDRADKCLAPTSNLYKYGFRQK